MISTELLAVIQAYQAAFRAPSFSGSRLSLEIGNLNSWFIGATITPDGRNITISRDGDFFDTEGYSVVPELVAALKRGMNGCGIIPPNEAYTVEVDQQTHKLNINLIQKSMPQNTLNFFWHYNPC